MASKVLEVVNEVEFPAQIAVAPVIVGVVGSVFTIIPIVLLIAEVQPVTVFLILNEYVPAAVTVRVLKLELLLHRYCSLVPNEYVVVKTVLPPVQIAVAPAIVGVVGKALIVIATALLVPFGVVTTMLPEVAEAGTVKVILVAVTPLKVPTLVPFMVTEVAPVKAIPVIETVAPKQAGFALKVEIIGDWFCS